MERRELADMLRMNRRVGVCSSDATSMKHTACGPASESMKFCSRDCSRRSRIFLRRGPASVRSAMSTRFSGGGEGGSSRIFP